MPYAIEPATWGGTRLPGSGRDYEDLIHKAKLDGPAALDLLRAVVADPSTSVERCYGAMGLLVSLQRQGLIRTADVVPILEDRIRQSSNLTFDAGRVDALGALVALSPEQGTREHPGIARVIAIARATDTSEPLLHDALRVLAESRSPAALETLVWGVLELRDRNGRFMLARAIGKDWSQTWTAKASLFIRCLVGSTKQRSDIDSGAILLALHDQDEPWSRRLGAMADLLIQEAIKADARMTGNMAELLTECFGGSADQAAQAIALYQRNHGVPDDALKALRIEVGGAEALSGIVKVLKDDLTKYFQDPIDKLNTSTVAMWQNTLRDARHGFMARTWMSVAVFAFGVLLAASASYSVIQGQNASAGTYMIVIAGLAIMLLVIYTGPLKEIRQSVTDLAISSTAFIAYVHRVLETSHTFSYYYLKEQITFEEMQKSGNLMTEAMNHTIEALGRRPIDSSQQVIERAVALALGQARGTKEAQPSNPVPNSEP